jgi:hypothetical protein
MILIVWVPMYPTNAWTIGTIEVVVVAGGIAVDELTLEGVDRINFAGWQRG